MQSVAVSDLKAHLSERLKAVKGGEEILVTERGKLIARIIPYHGSPDDNWERLAKEGRLKLPTAPLRPIPWPRVKDPDGLVLKAVLEERESGW